jgi:hypothetical protein
MKNRNLLLFLLCYILSLHAYAGTIPLADYHFDECIWDGTQGDVKDSSGNDYNGTSFKLSTTKTENIILRSGDFSQDSDKDYIKLDPSIMNGMNDFSISFWMKSSNSQDQSIISGARSSQNNEMLFFIRGGGTIFAPYIKGANPTIAIPDISDSTWHHLVWRRNGTTGQNCITIDGDTNTTLCANGTSGTLTIEGLVLGQDQDNVGGAFDVNQDFEGYLDEFKIYNQWISDTDVQEIYTNEHSSLSYDGTTREDLCAEPIAQYNFDECSWSGITGEVEDSIGGQNLTSENGAQEEASGVLCKSGLFDGVNDKVQGLFSHTFNNEVSLNVWIKTSGINNPYARVVEFSRNDGTYTYSTALAYDSSKKIIRGWTSNSSGTRSAEVSFDMQSNGFHDNAWHMITYVYDGSSAKLYVDAIKRDEIATNIVDIQDAQVIAIGGYGPSTNYDFKGNIDEVMIYDKAIKDTSISQIYLNQSAGKDKDGNTRFCKCSPPRASYQFDECSWNGTIGEVKDSIGLFSGGISNNSTTTAGKLCKAADFTDDSINDYVTLNDKALDGLSNFTITTWFKTSKTSNQLLLSGASSQHQNEMLLWLSNPTTMMPFIKDVRKSISLSKNVADDNWHMGVFTRNSSSGCFYLDGQLEGCQSGYPTGSINIDSGGLIIGQEQDSVGGSFDKAQNFVGYQDEVKIYENAMDATQIQKLYDYENSGKNFDGTFRNCNCCVNYGGKIDPLEFEGAEVTLKNTASFPEWTYVDFNKSFSKPPVVFILPETRGDHPAAVRIKDINETGFKAIFAEPQGEDGPHYDQNINYLAVNEGIHKIGNTFFEVGKLSTNKVQQANKGTIVKDEWDRVDNIFTSCVPAVVGQIQSVNNEKGIDINSATIQRSSPWMTTAIDTNTSGVYLSLERSETDEENITQNETIGYMIAPGNIQDQVIDDNNNLIKFETILKQNYFVGFKDGTCKSVSFINNYDINSIPLVAASKNSKNEKDGGWVRRCELDNTKIGLSIDEDGSSYSKVSQGYKSPPQDTERNHAPETASIFVFSGTIVIREDQNITSSLFDAWDIDKDINNRKISTKKVSLDFDLSLVALNDTNTALKDYNGSVCARIIDDANNSLSDWEKLQFSNNNKLNTTFNVTKSNKNARVQIVWKDEVTENCPLSNETNSTLSTDNFAIRPDKFDFNIPVVGYAGDNFTIDFSASNALDYNETLNSSFVVEANISKPSCFNGTLNVAPFNFENGVKNSVDANYSDVGDINITIKEKDGSEFAFVDRDDTSDEDRFITPKTKSMTIKPYELNITNVEYNTTTGADWLYMAGVNQLAQNVKATIVANDKNHNMVQNFTDACYAKDVNVQTNFLVNNTNSAVDLVYDDNSTASINDINKTILISKSSFATSKADFGYNFNILRDYKTPFNPISIALDDIVILTNNESKIDNNASTSSLISSNMKTDFYYGRVKTKDISTNKKDVNHSLHVEVYDTNKDSYVNGFHQVSLNWYVMKDDNNQTINETDFNASKTFSNSNDANLNISNTNYSNGILNFKISNPSEVSNAYIHVDVPTYLWHSRYYDYNISDDCAHHPCFRYDYIGKFGGNTIKSGDLNATTIGNEYNATKTKKGVKVFR